MKDIILKVIVYRCMIMVTQLVFLFIITGEATISLGVSFLFGIIATIEHIIFEKVWRHKK